MSERVEETQELLLAACREHAFTVTADLRVSENAAAVLLGYQAKTLQNMRGLGTAPPHYRRAVDGGKVSYRLVDLAQWIEVTREDGLWMM